MTLAFGETAARTLSTAINLPVADETALALIPSTAVAHLSVIQVGSAAWYYDKDSAASGSAGTVVLPSDSVGRFLIQTSTGTAVPTSRTVTAGAGMTGGGTLAADRSFAVGAGSGITVNADDVAVTFGAVGEMAAAANANGAGSTAKSARIDHTHAIQASSDSVAGTMSAANFAKLAAMQSFDATLVAGTVTKSTGIVVTSTTRVVSITPTVRGGTFPAGGFESLTAGNVVGGAGTGAVTITSRKADGTLENACTDTVSVLLAG